MREPSRLIDVESGTALQLLRAASDVPDPPADALKQTLLSLGVSAPGQLVAGTSVGVAKYVFIGIAAGFGASAALVGAQGAVTPPPASVARSGPLPGAPSKAAPDRSIGGAPAPPVSVTSSRARSSIHQPSIASPASSQEVDRGPSLAEENQYMNRARALLAGGQSGGALAVLDEYNARFREGQLAPEAALLHVRAYAAAGNAQAARELAERLLQRAPTGDYAARVREAAGLTTP
jgi:hypothetical protein